MNVNYKFSKDEMKQIESNFIVICDTREKKNEHIKSYFEKKKKPYIDEGLNTGDYSAKIIKDETLGIMRDVYIPVVIEKKNSIDELAQSFSNRERFEYEFIRARKQNCKIILLVEDSKGYENILNHNYKSTYEPKALYGSLKAFEARYNFNTIFLNPAFSGNFIWHTLWYYAKEII